MLYTSLRTCLINSLCFVPAVHKNSASERREIRDSGNLCLALVSSVSVIIVPGGVVIFPKYIVEGPHTLLVRLRI